MQEVIASIITGIVVISVGAFLGYKIIRAIATFVDSLQGVPESPSEDEGKEEGQQERL